MTPEYTALRDRINEILPERLKLEFGCEIYFQNFPESPITSLRPRPDGSWEVAWGCFHPELSASQYKILGKPLTIEDVLRALPTLNFVIGNDGTLYEDDTDDGDDGIVLESTEIAQFDLSKPLSDPENAEACAAISRLLDQKTLRV